MVHDHLQEVLIYMLRFAYSVPKKTMKVQAPDPLAQQQENLELYNGFETL